MTTVRPALAAAARAAIAARTEAVFRGSGALTDGGSLLAMLPAVEAAGGEIVGCHVLVDRSGGLQTLTSPTTGRVYPLNALWTLDVPTFDAGDATCPGCAERIPLRVPGSSGT